MTRIDRDMTMRALLDPRHMMSYSMGEWDLLVRQARVAGLLARVGDMLREVAGGYHVPTAPAAHFRAVALLGRAQRVEVRREANLVCHALASLDVRVIFLKGAGYLLGGLPAAKGRIFSDIDVLVPKDALHLVEATLMMDGWGMTHHTAYDQHYYRAWMHELPPMEHMQRGTILDIHHSILPQTASRQPDASKLITDAIPVTGVPGAYVLAPVDMALHSMTHLFHNEEFSHGLRDLSDLDLLLRHFGGEPAFWDRLVARAFEQNLERPLFYGLRYTARILGTPIPREVVLLADAGSPASAMLPLMDAIWTRALRTPHPSATLPLTGLALFALYVRAHWMRMPLPMLVRHLAVKGWRRVSEEEPVV